MLILYVRSDKRFLKLLQKKYNPGVAVTLSPFSVVFVVVLQKSADAAKAFLSLATANEPSRTDAEQILVELKSTYNIVPK